MSQNGEEIDLKTIDSREKKIASALYIHRCNKEAQRDIHMVAITYTKRHIKVCKREVAIMQERN